MRRRGRPPPALIKKYSNRRLYDTEESRYITLDELAAKVQKGRDVRVLDAKTQEDLTQSTLTQVIIEGRDAARLLPVPLLTQLIRMEDEAFGEFMGRYMGWALQLYIEAKRGAHAVAPYNPFATLPFTATNALARMVSGIAGWEEPLPSAPPLSSDPRESAAIEPEGDGEADADEQIRALREELEALKTQIAPKRRPARKKR